MTLGNYQRLRGAAAAAAATIHVFTKRRKLASRESRRRAPHLAKRKPNEFLPSPPKIKKSFRNYNFALLSPL
jgi:hypothetical protein